MKSKRILVCLMALILAFGLVGCGETTYITPDPIEKLEEEYISVDDVTVEAGSTAPINVRFFPGGSVDRVTYQIPTQYTGNLSIRNGQVTGLKAGTVSTVTCKTENTGHSDTFEVRVTGYVEDESGAFYKFNQIGGFEKMPAADNLSVADAGFTAGGGHQGPRLAVRLRPAVPRRGQGL